MKKQFLRIYSFFFRKNFISKEESIYNEQLINLPTVSQYKLVLSYIRTYFPFEGFTSQDLMQKLRDNNIEITPKQVYRLMNKFRTKNVIYRGQNPFVYFLSIQYYKF